MDEKGRFERFCDRYFREDRFAFAVAALFFVVGSVSGWMFADSLGANLPQHAALVFQGATIFMSAPILFNLIAGSWWSRR